MSFALSLCPSNSLVSHVRVILSSVFFVSNRVAYKLIFGIWTEDRVCQWPDTFYINPTVNYCLRFDVLLIIFWVYIFDSKADSNNADTDNCRARYVIYGGLFGIDPFMHIRPRFVVVC